MIIKEKTLKKSNNIFANKENGELWYLRGGYHNLTYFLDKWSLCPSETIPVDNKVETFLKFYNDKGELFGGFYPDSGIGYIFVNYAPLKSGVLPASSTFISTGLNSVCPVPILF